GEELHVVLFPVLAFHADLVDEAFLAGQLVAEVVIQAALVEAFLVAFTVDGQLVLVVRTDDAEVGDWAGGALGEGLVAGQAHGQNCSSAQGIEAHEGSSILLDVDWRPESRLCRGPALPSENSPSAMGGQFFK